MTITFPGESAEYRAARDRLLEQEIDLRRRMEAVAAARRKLPPGGEIPEDYVFQEQGADGGATDVRMSELFAPGKDSLAIYTFMFPRYPDDERPGPTSKALKALPLDKAPCPSCTAFLDQIDAAMRHAGPLVNFAAAAEAPVEQLIAFASERGWRNLRLLSTAGNSYKQDYNADYKGHGMPMLNVFHRDGRTIRHFWGSELFWAKHDPGEDPRHVGTLEPLWNLLDLTPQGRPADWQEQISYEDDA
ncbi:DUF899 family protein [Luteimonas salinilitoris]|uniref:DUF899 family protein n=1 Tax=Luteimonas salinilitoris TaxID=3237697 RepID=A0ABV4HPZ4_9GAMM